MIKAIGVIACIGYLAALIVVGGFIMEPESKRATLNDSKCERSDSRETKD